MRYNKEYGIPKEFKGKIFVFDDLFTEERQKNILDNILNKITYTYIDDLSRDEDISVDSDGIVSYQGRHGFCHVLRSDLHYYDGPMDDLLGSEPLSPHCSMVDDLMDVVTSKINFPVYDYSETKIFFQLNLDIKDKDIPDTPHIDLGEPHLSIIYYVNDSDGDTILYENMLDLDDDSQWAKRKDGLGDDYITPAFHLLVEKKRITPKQGRVVVFDGLYFHTAMQPRISGKRIIINCNVIANNLL